MIVDVYDLNLSEHSGRREQFEKYRHDVILKTNIRSENYTPKRFNIDEQLGTFMMVDREADAIAAVCAVFTPKCWPANIARMFNRSYIDPNYRAKGLSRSDGVTKISGKGKLGKWCQTYAYDAMVATCVANNIDVGVCTRENSGRSNVINLFLESSRQADPRWDIKSGYFLTCNDEASVSCWQRLIYVPISDADTDLVLSQLKTISSDEYTNRFLNAKL